MASKSEPAIRAAPRSVWVRIVSTKPLMTIRDVADVRRATAEGKQVLAVDLHPAGGKRLQEFSAGHVGNQIAFIVNGRVRHVVRVRDPDEIVSSFHATENHCLRN